MREGAEIVYQATFSRDGWRGRADFLVRVDEPSEARRLELRAARHEARAQREALGRPPARVVRGRDRRRPGPAARAHPRRSGNPGGRDVSTCRRRRLPSDGAGAPPATRRGAAGDVPVAVRALLPLRLHLRLPAALGRRRPPHEGRLDPTRPDREARDRRRHDVDRACRVAGRSPRPAACGRRDRGASRPGGAAAAPLSRRGDPLPPARARGAARARPAAGALGRRPLLRHGGRPVLRPGLRARVSLRRALARAGRQHELSRRSGRTTATASRRRSSSSSTSSRNAVAPIRTCTSITTPPTSRRRCRG